MGRHVKVKRKGLSRGQKKTKFRPQDPYYSGRALVEDPTKGRDRPPGKDEDLLDMPEVSTDSNMFSAGLASALFDDASSSAPMAAADDGLSARARRRQRAKERKMAAAEGGKGQRTSWGQLSLEGKQLDSSAAEAAGQQSDHKLPKLPDQLPGESVKHYKRRVNKAMQEHFQAQRCSATTARHREKRQQWEQKRKQKLKARQDPDKGSGETRDSGPARTERPEFGDVAQRPPILGSAAMKSRAKLTKTAEAPTGARFIPAGAAAGTAPKGSKAAHDMAEYADRVREAYAEIKRRRLGGGARAVGSGS